MQSSGNLPLHVGEKRQVKERRVTKVSIRMYMMENYKNVHVVMATVFCGNNPMNNFLFVITYLQFYKLFYKEP